MSGRQLLDGPIALTALFVLARPSGHWGSGARSGVLRPSAPVMPAVRPDIDKLARAILDGLTGTVWRDDSQVVALSSVAKVYGEPERLECAVFLLPGRIADATPEPEPDRIQLRLDGDGEAE